MERSDEFDAKTGRDAAKRPSGLDIVRETPP
jgi:hypothetical protein